MSSNFSNCDILELEHKEYDLIFGNPPWQNFVDLPKNYKQKIKEYFLNYDLVGNSQSLLLGGSRIDIAALVIQIAVKDFLKNNGEAFLFAPLSILLNDGANQHFRTYKVNDTPFSLVKVYDFNDVDVFNGIATRYSLIHLKRDIASTFPIPFERHEKGKWLSLLAKPLFHLTDPLSIYDIDSENILNDIVPIEIDKESVPRQGINTCGANKIFFFESYKEIDDANCLVNESITLPKKFVFPLITSKNFKDDSINPRKWVLLPYHSNGRPLELSVLKSYPNLYQYLFKHQEELRHRKGIMIGSWLKKGYWWALLGMGYYNFMPYKIVWEAYGKKEFCPLIFDGKWQANQSLQAFIPVRTLREADRVLTELSNPVIESYLLSLKMEGTMNWAQPGKIKKLINYKKEHLTLFD